MIGILIVTHGKLGDVLIDTAELILNSRPDAVMAVSINIKEDPDRLIEKIAKGIKAVNRKKGILILTDMFGGTPSNLSYSFLDEKQVEVVSGVNLPMLLKALNSREKMSVSELAECLESAGKKSISMASKILKGDKRRE
jgi:PTS system mannose-specific IIA component